MFSGFGLFWLVFRCVDMVVLALVQEQLQVGIAIHWCFLTHRRWRRMLPRLFFSPMPHCSSFMVVMVRYCIFDECFHLDKNIWFWEDSETPTRCFTSSHQDQWWLSCACALHFLAPKCFTRMSQSSSTKFFVLISFHSHSVFSSPSTSFPRSPLHEYTLNASRPSQLYFRQCYLVTGIYPITPRRCLPKLELKWLQIELFAN